MFDERAAAAGISAVLKRREPDILPAGRVSKMGLR
jgi:hypothetical protein